MMEGYVGDWAMPRLAIFDIDGTLVRADKSISSYTHEVIQRYRGLGGEVTLATGRIERAARRYWRELSITTPVVLYNGAVIHDPVKGSSRIRGVLNTASVHHVWELGESLPISPIYYADMHPHVARRDRRIEWYEQWDAVPCIEGSREEITLSEVVKV